MQVGDLVRWAPIEAAYHKYHYGSVGLDLANDRKCGIIVDRNPKYFFVFWQNKELLCQEPSQIEVIK